jgi:hypothetical protein
VEYDRVNPADAVAVFTAVRRANLALVARLSPKRRKQYGLHQERGRETNDHMQRMNAGHDQNHLAQIARIMKAAR